MHVGHDLAGQINESLAQQEPHILCRHDLFEACRLSTLAIVNLGFLHHICVNLLHEFPLLLLVFADNPIVEC